MSCKNCAYWVSPAKLEPLNNEVVAYCPNQKRLTAKKYACSDFLKRTGEPLGTGLSKYWMVNKFEDAAIIHDLQYEDLWYHQSSKKIDDELLSNCLKLSKSRLDRILAYAFYYIARFYGENLRKG